MPEHYRWLNTDETVPAEMLCWNSDTFLLDRLPQRFDEWGIREDWKPPVLLRMAADVPLTPGKHRFLMRVRGLSRLWVDGQLIAKSKPVPGSPSGEEPMTPVANAPIPGTRIAEHRQQEIFGEATVGESGTCRVVLESIVGGKAFVQIPVKSAWQLSRKMRRFHAAESNDLSAHFADRCRSRSRSSKTGRTAQNLTMQIVVPQQQVRTTSGTCDTIMLANGPRSIRRRLCQTCRKSLQILLMPSLLPKLTARATAAAETPIAEARAFHDNVLPILRDKSCSVATAIKSTAACF